MVGSCRQPRHELSHAGTLTYVQRFHQELRRGIVVRYPDGRGTLLPQLVSVAGRESRAHKAVGLVLVVVHCLKAEHRRRLTESEPNLSHRNATEDRPRLADPNLDCIQLRRGIGSRHVKLGH